MPSTTLMSRRSCIRAASKSRPLASTARILLKSCATPPVSCPIASIFCDWKSAAFAFSNASAAMRFSVISRVTLAKPINSPFSLRIASSTTIAQNLEPSLRTRRRGQRSGRQALGLVFLRVKPGEMRADDLILRITLDASRPDIPIGDLTDRRDHEDRIIRDALYQQAELFFALS